MRFIKAVKNVGISSLSFLCPGVIHFFLGHKKKGLGLLFAFLMLASAVVFSKNDSLRVVMLLGYLLVASSAAFEIWLELTYGKMERFKNSKVYLTALLLTTGMAALPLLWQSDAYKMKGKSLWTVTVISLAILFFMFIVKHMSTIDTMIKRIVD